MSSVKPSTAPHTASRKTGAHPAPTAARRRCPTPTGPPAHRGQHPWQEAKLIPKVHQCGPTRGLGSLLGYLFGPGENNARGGIHHNPRIVAVWAYATCGNLADLQPPLTPAGRHCLRRLTELLEQPVRIGFNPPTLPVWHCSVHNHPDDPILTDQQWEHAATEIVATVGFAPHGDLSAVRWVGIRHDDRHLHIVATRVRQDRRTAWTHSDYRKAQAACRELEKHYGLRRVGAQRAVARPFTPAELNKATRQYRGEVPRHELRRLVRAAADAAGHESDFLDHLRDSGLLVRPRASTTNPNQLAGYAIALPDDHNAAGETIWYSGASLAADLTLPKLLRAWRSP